MLCPWEKLCEKRTSLGLKFHSEGGRTRNIDARPSEVLDCGRSRGIGRECANSRNTLLHKDLLVFVEMGSGYGDDLQLTLEQIGSKSRHSVSVPLRPAILDGDILALNKAGFLQTPSEGRGEVAKGSRRAAV